MVFRLTGICFGQFKSIVDLAILSNGKKLAKVKLLVMGTTQPAIAECSQSGVLGALPSVLDVYALTTLQRNFEHIHAVVAAHLDKSRNFF